ncbi:MAG TPA: maleylpyruvate isomerase family mycothiol-dependent enzyme [Micromonosporaceae bacterium]|nr:maleylpyruvate isomerase family mycothiol-dependent enzyme [Micromonosporaceae bacterium]
MSSDPLVLMAEVDRATERLLRTADTLDGTGTLNEPSLLPGWTRGHVLTHLARNADGLTNLLTWARTGEVTPQYPSWERRNADIEAGADRPVPVVLADLSDACARFAAAAEEMPAEAWTVQLDLSGGPQPAARVVWRRLREVEVHHVDLAAGYGTADWPDSFSHRLLHEVVRGLSDFDVVVHATDLGHPLTVGASSSGAPTVTGPAHALAGWLTGRTSGSELTVSPPGPLPVPPQWI